MPVNRLPKIGKAHRPCMGGCGRHVYTAFCDGCAPPTVFRFDDNERAAKDAIRGAQRRNGRGYGRRGDLD